MWNSKCVQKKTRYSLTSDKLIISLTCSSWQLCLQKHPRMPCLMHIDHLSFFGGLEPENLRLNQDILPYNILWLHPGNMTNADSMLYKVSDIVVNKIREQFFSRISVNSKTKVRRKTFSVATHTKNLETGLKLKLQYNTNSHSISYQHNNRWKHAVYVESTSGFKKHSLWKLNKAPVEKWQFLLTSFILLIRVGSVRRFTVTVCCTVPLETEPV